jgi:hypothetical protein
VNPQEALDLPEVTGNYPLSTRFLAELRAEFPRFRVLAKRTHHLSQVIDYALKIITFGAQRSYLTHYHTVIGWTLYVPESWERTPDVARVIILRHERVHLRQRRRYGLPLVAFLYLLPILPLGLAYGRARLEWEAYEETLRATAEHRGLEPLRSDQLKQEIVRRFTSADYGWMWPFARQVGTWYDASVERLEREHPLSSPSRARGEH